MLLALLRNVDAPIDVAWSYMHLNALQMQQSRAAILWRRWSDSSTHVYRARWAITRYDLMVGGRDYSKSISLHRTLDRTDKNISLDVFAVRRLRKGAWTIVRRHRA